MRLIRFHTAPRWKELNRIVTYVARKDDAKIEQGVMLKFDNFCPTVSAYSNVIKMLRKDLEKGDASLLLKQLNKNID